MVLRRVSNTLFRLNSLTTSPHALQVGRFNQPDPIGYAGGTNLYAYVGNDPLNATDPNGTCPWCAVGAVAAFGVDLTAQYVESRLSNSQFQIDWTRSAVATGAGAITGGASAWLGTAISGSTAVAIVERAVANSTLGAIVNTGQTATTNYLENRNDNLISVAGYGAAFGAAGSVVGDAIGILQQTITNATAGQQILH